MFHDLICAVICKYDPGLSAFDTWSRKKETKDVFSRIGCHRTPIEYADVFHLLAFEENQNFF